MMTYFVFLSPTFFVDSSLASSMSALKAFTSSSVVVVGKFFMNNVFLGRAGNIKCHKTDLLQFNTNQAKNFNQNHNT